MRHMVVFLVTSLILFGSCVKENTPGLVLDNTVDTTVAIPQNNGNFMNGPFGSVSGMATVYSQDGELVLALEDMRISNGPQLHVYLSKGVQPVNFIDLGPLQSTMGNQLYNIEGKPDLSLYKYALVHCKKYNHLFGSAKLQ